MMEMSYHNRTNLARESKRKHISNTLQLLGYTAGTFAGMAFEKLVDFVMNLFFRRF